jgi:hypothetical protein
MVRNAGGPTVASKAAASNAAGSLGTRWFERACIGLPPDDSIQGRVDAFPFREELLEHGFAVRGEDVKALVALVFFAPLADEEALGLETAQQGIQSAFIDGHAVVGESFAEGVAVLLGAELGEDGEDEGAATKLEAKVFEEIRFDGHTVPYPLYDIHCMTHSMCCQVVFLSSRRYGRQMVPPRQKKAAGLRRPACAGRLRPALQFCEVARAWAGHLGVPALAAKGKAWEYNLSHFRRMDI